MLRNAATVKTQTKTRTSLAIAHRLLSSSPLNVAIGVAPHEMVVPPPHSPLFIPTDLNTLDVTDSDDFEFYFPPNSVSAFIAEHVWEHLSLQDGIDALINVRISLKAGGVVRIAVPDRFSYCGQDEAEMHRADIRDEHLVQYDYGLLREVFKSAGFTSEEITLLEYHTAQGQHVVSPLSDEDPVFQFTNIQRRYRNGRVGPGSSLIVQATKTTAPPLPNNSLNSSSTSPSSKCTSTFKGSYIPEIVSCALTVPRQIYARQLAELCLAHELPRLADFFFDLALELGPTRELKFAATRANLGGQRTTAEHFIFSGTYGVLETIEDGKELKTSLERLGQHREAARAQQIANSRELVDAQILHLCARSTHSWRQTLSEPAPQELLLDVDLSCFVGSHDVPGVIACSHVAAEGGGVLQATCEGSFAFATLPNGQYSIVSKLYSYDGIAKLDSKSLTFEIESGSLILDSVKDRTASKKLPLSFITIVLNGADFLQHHYKTFEKAALNLGVDFEWHVIEGVAEGRQDANNPYSTSVLAFKHRTESNLSVDGTTKYLNLLSREHKNVHIHRVAPKTFKDKIHQINTALPFLQKSILLQVDADELWSGEGITKAYEALTAEGEQRTCLKVDCHFFVGEEKVVEGAGGWGHGDSEWVRGWKFEPGSLFVSHAPPVLAQPNGDGEWLAADNCIHKEEATRRGIGFSHHAYMFESQVQFKEDFYGYDGAVAGWRALQNVEKSGLPVKANGFLPWLKKGAKNYETRFEDTMVVDVEVFQKGELNFPMISLGPDAHIDSYLDLSEGWSKRETCSFKVMVDCVTFQRSRGGITRVWSEVLPRLVRNLAGEGACFIFLVREGGGGGGGGREQAGWAWAKALEDEFDFEVEFVDVPIFPEGGDEGGFVLDSEILGAIARERGSEVFVSTQYTFPSSVPSVRNILLIHDLTPETFGWEEEQWKLKAKAVKNADIVVTVSAATTEKLKLAYGEDIPVLTSRNGVDDSIFYRRGEKEVERLRAELALGDVSYLLVVGQRGGYKSTHALVQTLRYKFAKGMAPAVVFVGGGDFDEEERRGLGELMAWHFPDVGDETLAGLYSGSAGLVYLSLDEGFGLPIVEALSCGCGVVATDIKVFHEVAGGELTEEDGGIIFVNPSDPSGIFEGISTLLRREEEGKRTGNSSGHHKSAAAIRRFHGEGWQVLTESIGLGVKDVAVRACSSTEFVSQQGQDSWAWEAFGGKGGKKTGENRWFVELGANDGITLSNTYALERCGGWRGVCIEPTAAYDSLLSSGRVKCSKMREAVAGGIRKATLIGSKGNVEGLSTGGTLWAGLSEHFMEKSTWQAGGKVAKDESSIAVLNSGGDEEVLTTTLGDVLDAAGAPNHVDFLSLDVEGAEFEILESFPFDVRSFGLIVVEHAYVEEMRSQIFDLLESNGYVRSICFDSDDGYVLKSLVEPGGELEDMPFNDVQCNQRNKRIFFKCKGLEKEELCRENDFGAGECDGVFELVQGLWETHCTRGADFHSFSLSQPLQVEVPTIDGYDSNIFIESESMDWVGSWSGAAVMAKKIAMNYCKDNHSGILTGEGMWGLTLEECETQLLAHLMRFLRNYSDEVKGKVMKP
ncbi:hypothetical protein TrVE_jg8554 [Triparma verrucosa]|uniref:Methyltransferase FkbM domain-containing protein n=1 Tax=Triparma verrucosa TaxID=1606542 RepID=A0A9W7KTZ1_9STRA|nr:hypothetical protein TrVE_jg8554 [Triparma verrucosa]